ncbi:MAG: hypothetical protein ACI9P5_004883, partial [Saprospiraceae bacterium]
ADLPEALRADPSKLRLPPYFPDTEKVRELYARHYDNISMMDIRVGEILQELEEDGLADNTIIVFFSDHGTGVPRHKRWLYDSGIKVPLIVKSPERYQTLMRGKPGSVNDEIVCFIDLPATVLNLANIDVPQNMQGRAFLGKSLKPERAYAYSARDRMDERYDMQRAVRSKQFKYIRYYESYKPYTQFMNTPEQGEIMMEIRKAQSMGKMPIAGAHIIAHRKADEELFDLQNDPYELNNLANNPNLHEVLLEMRNAHARWSDNTKDSGLIPETIMRAWEQKEDKSIYKILRERNVPITKIREAALGNNPKELTQALQHDNEAVRYWAAISLGNLPLLATLVASKKELNKLLDDEVPAVRIAAARALCKVGQFQKPLIILNMDLSHPDDWVRLLATQVLDEIGEDARPVESSLQKVVDEGDINKYVVRVANRALNVLNGTNNVVR